jgi:hypothetical protein
MGMPFDITKLLWRTDVGSLAYGQNAAPLLAFGSLQKVAYGSVAQCPSQRHFLQQDPSR